MSSYIKKSHRNIIDLIIENTCLKDIKLSNFNFDNITDNMLVNVNEYEVIHDNINNLLDDNNIQHCDLYDLINNYNGSNRKIKKLKQFIINRNLLKLKNIYKSNEWNKIIKKYFLIYNKIINCNIINFEEIILQLLLNYSIVLYDIYNYKIIIDKNNILIDINLNDLNDQKYILLKLKNSNIV